jgi:hypothetical protein
MFIPAKLALVTEPDLIGGINDIALIVFVR